MASRTEMKPEMQMYIPCIDDAGEMYSPYSVELLCESEKTKDLAQQFFQTIRSNAFTCAFDGTCLSMTLKDRKITTANDVNLILAALIKHFGDETIRPILDAEFNHPNWEEQLASDPEFIGIFPEMRGMGRLFLFPGESTRFQSANRNFMQVLRSDHSFTVRARGEGSLAISPAINGKSPFTHPITSDSAAKEVLTKLKTLFGEEAVKKAMLENTYFRAYAIEIA